jgi:hypothetical protein
MSQYIVNTANRDTGEPWPPGSFDSEIGKPYPLMVGTWRLGTATLVSVAFPSPDRMTARLKFEITN